MATALKIISELVELCTKNNIIVPEIIKGEIISLVERGA